MLNLGFDVATTFSISLGNDADADADALKLQCE